MKIIVKGTRVQVYVVSDDGKSYLHIPRQGETISISSKKYRVVEVETRISAGYHFDILSGLEKPRMDFEKNFQQASGKISDINIYVEEI